MDDYKREGLTGQSGHQPPDRIATALEGIEDSLDYLLEFVEDVGDMMRRLADQKEHSMPEAPAVVVPSTPEVIPAPPPTKPDPAPVPTEAPPVPEPEKSA